MGCDRRHDALRTLEPSKDEQLSSRRSRVQIGDHFINIKSKIEFVFFSHFTYNDIVNRVQCICILFTTVLTSTLFLYILLEYKTYSGNSIPLRLKDGEVAVIVIEYSTRLKGQVHGSRHLSLMS